MGGRVVLVSDGHRVEGCGADGELVNQFLAHLGSRAFSSANNGGFVVLLVPSIGIEQQWSVVKLPKASQSGCDGAVLPALV